MNPQQPIEQPNPGQQPAAPAQQVTRQAQAQGQAPMPAPQPVGQVFVPGAPVGQPAQQRPAALPFMPGAAPQQPVAGRQPTAQTTATPPPKIGNPNSTQNALQIAEIRDGIVIMNDGSFRSVVMLKSINFDLMSPQEQEAVEFSYQGFLNSLYFPIQIYVSSQRVDLQPYIEKLDKIRTEHDNMLLALLMEDYIQYIDNVSQSANIMDKKFYIVIPYFPHEEAVAKNPLNITKGLDQSTGFINNLTNLFSKKEMHVTINEADLEEAKTELRNRVQALLNGLMQASIQGLPLDTQELIELYHNAYNPDTATRQKLKNFDNLTADIITKGDGMAPKQHLQREMN